MNPPVTRWPGRWIGPPSSEPLPHFNAYRLDFECSETQSVSVRVTADQRYILWLDGVELGRGPERGDLRNWYCNSYLLQLSPGKHRLTALVWFVSLEYGTAPHAQLGKAPGFYLSTDSILSNRITTGLAPWEIACVSGVKTITGMLHGAANQAGCLFRIDGARWPTQLHLGEGLEWNPATPGPEARSAPDNDAWGSCDARMLQQPSLPSQTSLSLPTGRVRFVEKPASADTEHLRVSDKNGLPLETGDWQAWIEGKKKMVVPPSARRRVLIDLGTYACAYSRTVVTDGTGGFLRISWAESLFEEFAFDGLKGDRNEIEGKVFVGRGDQLDLTGSGQQILEPLWWNAGRYLEILVEAGEKELVLESFTLRETRYPFEREDQCEVPLPDWSSLHRTMWRTLQMCSHETYMDCPYYEQLQYSGDTRLQILVTHVSTRDARLPAKTLRLFSSSMGSDGLTSSAYPSSGRQIIPQFSLFWVAMLHDHLFWRGDLPLIQSLLPNSRRVMDTFLQLIQEDGTLSWPTGWNWVDWSEAWRKGPHSADHGHPALDNTGLSGINALHFVYISGLAAELEEKAGEAMFSERYRRARATVMQAARARFWDEHRGLFADTPSKKSFSEHAQCYAVLGGLLTEQEKSRIAESLGQDSSLAPASVYFRHYLFEAFTALGVTEHIVEGLGPWREFAEMGCFTTLERPDPSRSDCHAWGAHPIYHLYASLLGIRPSEPGFRRVSIRPQLGGLPHLQGKIPHPEGFIEVDLKTVPGGYEGHFLLPEGIAGDYFFPAGKVPLHPGLNPISSIRQI